MLRPQHRLLLAVTSIENLGVAPLGGWAGSHPSYSAPSVAESTSVFTYGYLGNQARQDVRREVSITHTSEGHGKDRRVISSQQ